MSEQKSLWHFTDNLKEASFRIGIRDYIKLKRRLYDRKNKEIKKD